MLHNIFTICRYLEAGDQARGFVEQEGKAFCESLLPMGCNVHCIAAFTDDDVERKVINKQTSLQKQSAAQPSKGMLFLF